MARAKVKAKAKGKPAKPAAKAKAKPVAKAATAKAVKPSKGIKAKTSSKPVKKSKAVAQAPARPAKAAKSQPKKVSMKTDWDSMVTPLDDRLIVKIEAHQEKTEGGLYIPSTVSAERPSRGIVMAVGRGHLSQKGRIKPMDVKEGDEVLFAAFSGTEMKIQGEDVVILREADLLGIVD